ncbi:unnamed protein product [Thelazia callipaeda]|uniref:C-type lectin domain-containing protein n=1 Tax=Thelazia callipaeda TaxID=103827 RepID=A0A3P7KB70_THECL|nr:unnamed protein product [Thelazia callipaeda]
MLSAHVNFLKQINKKSFVQNTLNLERCRTNNDCISGRCEWRRCIEKFGILESNKEDIGACFYDGDCDEGYTCDTNVCRLRSGLLTYVVKPEGAGRCLVDLHCSGNLICTQGAYCAALTDAYRRQTLTNIASNSAAFILLDCNSQMFTCPTKSKLSDSYCGEITNYESKAKSSVCRTSTVTYLFMNCDQRRRCPFYYECIIFACHSPRWVTWDLKCRVSTDCNRENSNEFMCHNLVCLYRDISLSDCCLSKLSTTLLQIAYDANSMNFVTCKTNVNMSSDIQVKEKLSKNDAEQHCKNNNMVLASIPDRGTEKELEIDDVMLHYLALQDNWIQLLGGKNMSDEREFVFPRQYGSTMIKRGYLATSATKHKGQKCQTFFTYYNGNCYIAYLFKGFSNYMPRFAIRSICHILDSEMIDIRNEEEALIAYGMAGGRSFWLGLKKEKGEWYWNIGDNHDPAIYFFWTPGEPRISEDKNCAFSPNAGEWKATDCSSNKKVQAYVCKSKS